MDVHCRLRHNNFQIRKCDDIECCSPSQAICNCIPDPVLDVNGNHYKSFESTYRENDTPTLMKKTQKKQNQLMPGKRIRRTDTITNLVPEDPVLRGKASVFTAQNARYTLACIECDKPILIYGKS